MFLCAIGRPRDGWDGKVGIWPLVETRYALRNSRNRPAGTPELHCVPMTAERYKEMICSLVIPAIAAKCPGDMKSRTIILQHDNASAHNSVTTWTIRATADLHNLIIIVKPQPAKSADLNNLDNSVLNSCQADQYRIGWARNKTELINMMNYVFDNYPAQKLNFAFLSMMMNMNEILKCHGDNDYKVPHMAKEALFRRDELPLTIPYYDPLAEAAAGAAATTICEVCELINNRIEVSTTAVAAAAAAAAAATLEVTQLQRFGGTRTRAPMMEAPPAAAAAPPALAEEIWRERERDNNDNNNNNNNRGPSLFDNYSDDDEETEYFYSDADDDDDDGMHENADDDDDGNANIGDGTTMERNDAGRMAIAIMESDDEEERDDENE